MLENDDDVLQSLKKKREEVERYLCRLNAAIAALRGSNGEMNAEATSGGVVPPIVDITRYLAEHPGPVRQSDIIRAVGELRQKRYPALTNHYSNVWRALEYHIRHDRLIACVNQHGRTVKLKPLPRRPKGKKLHNLPELYLQDNWFTLKEESNEERYAVRSQRSQLGQD